MAVCDGDVVRIVPEVIAAAQRAREGAPWSGDRSAAGSDLPKPPPPPTPLFKLLKKSTPRIGERRASKFSSPPPDILNPLQKAKWLLIGTNSNFVARKYWKEKHRI